MCQTLILYMLFLDLWYAQTGDRIWWTWSGHHVDRMDSTFTICEIEKTLNPSSKQESSDEGGENSTLEVFRCCRYVFF